VIDHTTVPNQSLIDHRRKQVRLATARHRKRHKHGLFLRTITVTNRGEARAECEAIETFIMDSLLKP
jgi:hypothetical protein